MSSISGDIEFNFHIPRVPVDKMNESNNSSSEERPTPLPQTQNGQTVAENQDVLNESMSSTSTTMSPDVSFFKDVDTDMDVYDLKRTVEKMCTRIFRTMGPGFREKVYQHCLEHELHLAGFVTKSEFPVPFFYMDVCVGVGYLDILVQNRLIVELKAVTSGIAPQYINQAVQYMHALNVKHGLVINFPQNKTREEGIDIFDCFLGQKITVSKLTYDQIKMANMGVYGPAPRKKQRSFQCAEPYEVKERVRPFRSVTDANEEDEEDEQQEGRDKREFHDDDEQNNVMVEGALIPAVSSTLYLSNGQQIIVDTKVKR